MSCNCITVITVNDIESAPGFGGKLYLAFFELILKYLLFLLIFKWKSSTFLPVLSKAKRRYFSLSWFGWRGRLNFPSLFSWHGCGCSSVLHRAGSSKEFLEPVIASNTTQSSNDEAIWSHNFETRTNVGTSGFQILGEYIQIPSSS